MFSEGSVRHFVPGVSLLYPSGQRPSDRDSPELTSSCGHCSGQYTSYWNAFLFIMKRLMDVFSIEELYLL